MNKNAVMMTSRRNNGHAGYWLCVLITCVLLLSGWSVNAQQDSNQDRQTAPRSKVLFDFGWRFHRGGSEGAERPDMDDTGWQPVNLPHDWSIENLPGTASPFDSNAVGQVATGFTVGGVGWYRKTFKIAADKKGKIVQIQFDGVYMNADVWLNGHHLGSHPYGYTSFWYDISPFVRFGEKNVLAVKVQNVGQNSRWYSGSGIYRHVWLSFLDSVHVTHWGVAVTTPEADRHTGKIDINVHVVNRTTQQANVAVVTHILDADGKKVAECSTRRPLAADSIGLFAGSLTVKDPHLWSVDDPYRYTALTEVFRNGTLSDRTTTRLGIRKITFDANRGFQLNGVAMKLKGGCVHHDNGPLGARSFDKAEIRKVALLKASGLNAIRCAHNPPAPALLDAADSMGMLVIDEAFDMWETGKNPYDYHLYFDKWWKKDLQSMVLRDRNHPSVILWSIGNEIPDMNDSSVARIARRLADEVRSVDPSRPVTAAVNNPDAGKDPFVSALDIAGYNYGLYRHNYYLSGHERKPDRVMVATESFSPQAFDYWMAVEDHPWIIGDFVWTAWDYIGESAIGWFNWPQSQNYFPWHLAYTGDIDVCGWKRPQSYYRDVLWKTDQLSLFVKPPKPSFPPAADGQWSKWRWEDVVADWNWKGWEGKPFAVTVYSSCDEVELLLNGKSLGRKATNRSTRFTATFEVPYQPGTLQAIGYDEGKQVNTAVLKTAQAAAQIRLKADTTAIRADGEDLSYVTVEVTDPHGVRVPDAENMLHFRIAGPGTIVGVGNANPRDTESYQLPQRSAWKGRCLVIIRSKRQPGRITLTVSSEGLAGSDITITSR